MNVNAKYIKDENGNIISPITAGKTTFMESGNNIEDGLAEYKLLYLGSVWVPSRNSGNKITLTLLDNINNYTYIMFNVLDGVACMYNIDRDFNKSINQRVRVCMSVQSSIYSTERLNAFRISSYTKFKYTDRHR